MAKSAPQTPIFLSDAVEVEGSRVEVEHRLDRAGLDLLPLVGQATSSGESVLMTVGPSVGEHLLGIPAEVRLGPCTTRGGCSSIPIRWEAAAFDSIFPVLDGTLLICPLGMKSCQLAIEASYRPPLDRIGALIDRAVLHRVAEATVHEFLLRVGALLSLPRPTTGDGQGLHRRRPVSPVDVQPRPLHHGGPA